MADRTIPAFKILRGNVGVGTTLPSSTFHVYSDSSTNTIINLQGGSATNKGAYMNFFRGTTNVGALGTKASLIGGTSNDMMFYSASNDWIFYSTGERMRVQADGLVGIGTNAPSSLLHVYGSSSYLLDVHQTAINWAARIKNTSGGGYGLSIDTSTSTANNVATLACYTPSGTGVFVTNQGRLAVGLTAPEAPLDVSGNSIVRGTLYFDGLSSSYIDNASHDLQMRGAGGVSLWTHTGGSWVEQVTVADGGSVGIGTDAPAVELHINDASGLSAIRLTGGAASADGFQIMQGVTGVTNAGFSIYDVDATATRLVIDTNGNVGIGTGTPVKKLDVRASESWDGIHIGSTAGSATAIDFARSATHANPTARIGVAEPDATHTSDMRFYTSDATGSVPNLVEKMRIDPLGRVLIGVNGAMPLRWWNGTTYGAKLFVENNGSTAAADYVTAGVVRNTNDGEAPQLGFAKSRGTTTGAVTVVQSGDAIGTLTFQGADGTNYVEAARINAIVDGTPGADDMPGRLQFSTTADGTASPTVRMVIMSDGNVGIGTVSPAAHLHVSKGVGATTVLTQVAANSTVGYEIKKTGSTTQHWKIVDGQTANGYLEIYDATDSATRMAFNTAGNVGIGTVNAPHLLTLKGDGKYFAAYASDGSMAVQLGSDSSGDGNFILYDHSGGTKVKLYAESGGANYINNGGSVGIGTNNPTATLQVGTVTDSSTTAASLVHLASATASSTVNGFSTLKLDYKSGHAPSTVGAQIMFNQGYHSGNQDYTAPVGSVRGWKTGASDNYGGGLQFLYQPDSGSLGLLVGMTLEGSGHVGIGTNAPAYPLHVYYAGGAAIGMQVKGTANRAKLVVTDNDTSAYVIAEDSHASFGRQDALSTNNLNINSDGSVGIGTNAASTFCKLNVKGAVRLGRGSDDLGSYNGDDFDLFVGYGANGSKIMLYDDQAAYHSALIQYGNALLRIGLNNSNSAPSILDASAINIIPAGVGIGIGVFTARLAVKSAGSTTDQIVVVHSGNSVEIAQLGQSANGSSAGTLLLKNNSGTDKIYLDAAGTSVFKGGDIGFYEDTGTTARFYWSASNERLVLSASDYQLQLQSGSHIWFTKVNSSGKFGIHKNGATDYLTIDTNGNCGVGGVTSPTSLLHVAGDLGNSAYIAYIYNSGSQSEDNGLNLQVASSGSSCYALRVNTGGDGTTLVATGSGNVGIGYTPSNITEKFCVNGKTRLQSSGDGNNVLECIDSAGDAMFNIRQSSNDCLIRGYKDSGVQTLQFHSHGESYIMGNPGGNTDLQIGGSAVTSHGTVVMANGTGASIAKIRVEGSDDSFYVSKLAGGGLFHFTSNNSFQFNQNVKLQTTDHVILDLSTPSGNNYTILRFSPNGTQASYIRAQTNGDVIFDNSGGTVRMKMSNNGFIQIGNNLPVWSGSYGGALLLKGNNATSDRYAQLTTVDSNGAVTNTGLIVKSGDVGIGTNAPARALDVDGRVLADTYGFRSDTSLRYYYFDNYSGSNFMGRGGNAFTSLYDGGTQSMVWKGNGVGIGTNNPTQTLVVAKSNSGGVGGSIRIDNLAGAAADKTQLIFSSFGDSYHRAMIQCTVESSSPYGGTLEFYTGIKSGTFTEKMRVDHNGYVGIGTNNPAQLLHMEGTVVKLRMKETGSQTWDLYAAGSRWALRVNDADKLTVNNGGNVGVGTDAPTNQLHVYNATDISPSSAGAGQFAITGNGYTGFIAMDGSAMYFGHNSSGRDLRLMTNETTRLYINGSGSVSVPGSFSASSKSFLIDHPTKENKKLEYGCLEGPEFGVYHRGRVQSNTITLPDYWTALVREETITVQLTSKGSFQHLYVVSQSLTEIVIGAADGETIDCFYTVYGERADIDRLEVEKEV